MDKLNKLKKKLLEAETSDLDAQRTRDTVKTLWPEGDILSIPKFYERPVFSIPHLSEKEYIDSLKRKNVLKELIDSLSLFEVKYRGFDNRILTGQIIIHKEIADSTKQVFKRILKETDFPMTSVIPISLFDWNSSLKFNNTSGFDFRFVDSSNEISDHDFGAAIDINPLINPWIREGITNRPYDPNLRGTLHHDSHVVKIFKEAGWKWGGDWENSKDWQHFYRPEIPFKYYGKVEVKE